MAERNKLVLEEKASKPVPKQADLEECMELSLRFLARRCNIYKNGDYALKRTVLKLAFSKPLTYWRNEAYGTTETTFPFNMLGGLEHGNGEVVHLERESLNSLFDTLQEWEAHLALTDLNDLRCEDETNAP